MFRIEEVHYTTARGVERVQQPRVSLSRSLVLPCAIEASLLRVLRARTKREREREKCIEKESNAGVTL